MVGLKVLQSNKVYISKRFQRSSQEVEIISLVGWTDGQLWRSRSASEGTATESGRRISVKQKIWNPSEGRFPKFFSLNEIRAQTSLKLPKEIYRRKKIRTTRKNLKKKKVF